MSAAISGNTNRAAPDVAALVRATIEQDQRAVLIERSTVSLGQQSTFNPAYF
jgi:hypothetical protein